MCVESFATCPVLIGGYIAKIFEILSMTLRYDSSSRKLLLATSTSIYSISSHCMYRGVCDALTVENRMHNAVICISRSFSFDESTRFSLCTN